MTRNEMNMENEFIEWIGFETPHRLFYRDVDNKWMLLKHIYDSVYVEMTTDELYKYWSEEVKPVESVLDDTK